MKFLQFCKRNSFLLLLLVAVIVLDTVVAALFSPISSRVGASSSMTMS